MINQICRRLAIVSLLAASVAVSQLSAQSAEPRWYTFCVGSVGGRADLYFSDIFTMSRDALAGLGVQNSFKAFLQDRYAKPLNTVANNVSCLTNRFPTEQQVRSRKDQQISNYAQFHKQPGSGTIIETHWTPAGAPANETAPAPAAASSEPPSSQPSPPSGSGSAEPEIYTFCYAQSGNTIYVSDIFTAPPNAPDNIAMTYRQLVSDKYQRPLRSISFGCDHTGLASESQARERKTSTIKNMQSDPAYTNLVETGWNGGEMQAPAAASAVPADQRLNSLPPATRNAVLDEAKSNQAYCESNATLNKQYDCACYARQLLTARLDAGAKVGYAAGGRPVMIPNAASLLSSANLTSCRR